MQDNRHRRLGAASFPAHAASLTALVVLALMALPACGATRSIRAAGEAAPRPAVINHVVLFKLIDGADADALVADCIALLAPVPEVISFFAGRHVDVGRDSPSIVTDYDVGLYVGFADVEAYGRYIEHPDHLELVDRWGPKFEWVKVHDIRDDGSR